MPLLETLPTLVSLHQTGSISGTARSMGVPRSTVSRRLARAEQALGVVLAERNNRSFRLTAAGEILATGAAEVLARIRTLAETTRAAAGSVRGELRVSAPPGLAGPYLSPFLIRFTEQFPGVRLKFHVRDQAPHLIDDAFDLVFVTGPLPDSPWVRHALAPSWYMLAASPEYLDGRVLSAVDQLREHRLLTARQPGLSDVSWPVLGGPPLAIDPIVVTNDLGILHDLVRQGRGIGLVPVHLVAEDLLAGALLPLLTEQIGLEIQVSALYSPERRKSPLIRALLDSLDRFAGELLESMADLGGPRPESPRRKPGPGERR